MRQTLTHTIEQTNSSHKQVEISLELACQLIEAGQHEEARQALAEFWTGPGERPSFAGLDQTASAELLLVAGRITSVIGAQGDAKDLLSESIRMFDAGHYARKSAESRKELAICYWREGAHDEARALLSDALELLGPTDSELKARTVQCAAIVEFWAGRHEDALRQLTEHASLFAKVTNNFVKGGYHNDLANVLTALARSQNRDDLRDRAILEFTAASCHFELSGHVSYQAYVLNNLALALMDAGKFEEAHEHLRRARRLYTGQKDKFSVAEVDDTTARVLLAEGKTGEAEGIARRAVCIQERGDRTALLCDALTTHATALARLNYHEQARQEFTRAIDTAVSADTMASAAVAALTMLEELHEQLTGDELRAVYARADELLAHAEPYLVERLRRSARLVFAGMNRTAPPPTVLPKGKDLQQAIEEYERECIREALAATGGQITRAARILGLTHQGLDYMLQTRHAVLVNERKPRRQRRRHIYPNRVNRVI